MTQISSQRTLNTLTKEGSLYSSGSKIKSTKRFDSKYMPFPLNKQKAALKGIRFSTNGKVSSFSEFEVYSELARRPSRTTTTKPDVNLLFSLFSIFESEESENSCNDNEASLSPSSSPIFYSPQQQQYHQYQQYQQQQHEYQQYQQYQQQQQVSFDYSQQVQVQAQQQQQVYQQQYSQECSVYPQQNLVKAETMNNNINGGMNNPCFESSTSEGDYSESPESEIVNNYNGLAWLPPICESHKVPERVMPLSELVNVFCL